MRVTVHQVSGQNSDMCVRTRCRSVDELVSLFGRYLEGNSLFVATLGARGEGAESTFTISLADGAIALRGRGIIEKAWTNAENPFRLPGILLAVRTLTASSKALFDRIRSERTRTAGNTAPLTRVPPPLADISSVDDASRWQEETLIGPPLAGRDVVRPMRRPLTLTIPPSQVRAAAIPAVPRTTTPLRVPPKHTPPATQTEPEAPASPTITRPVTKHTITRPKIAFPALHEPPIHEPRVNEPTTAEPTIAALQAPVSRREFHRARTRPAEPELSAEVLALEKQRLRPTVSDTATTIPELVVRKPPRRMAWWTAVLFVLLPVAGFVAGDARGRGNEPPPTVMERAATAREVPVRASVEIEGTTYSIDVVLTPRRTANRAAPSRLDTSSSTGRGTRSSDR